MLGYYFIYYWEGLAYEADHGTGPCGPIALAGKKKKKKKGKRSRPFMALTA